MLLRKTSGYSHKTPLFIDFPLLRKNDPLNYTKCVMQNGSGEIIVNN